MSHRLPFLSPRTVTLRSDGLSEILEQATLTVARVTGKESLNDLFSYDIDLKTPDTQWGPGGPAANLDLPSLQGKELTLEIQLEGYGRGLAGNVGAGTREITGIVTQVIGPISEGRHYVYRLTLQPWLFLATLTSDYRLFQQKTVVEILSELLADYIFPVDNRLDVARYPKREYQVQYGETDYAFFKRLTEEWGITFFFAHSERRHRLVLTDGNGAFRRCASPAYHTLLWRPSPDRADAEHLYDFHVHDQLVSGKWCSNDYDFVKPRADLAVATDDPRDTAHAGGEIYRYPGDHAQPATGNDPWREGDMLARIRMEAIRQHGSRVAGAGNVRCIVAGTTFALQGFAQAAANREYLVIATELTLEDVAEASGQGHSWHCVAAFQAQSSTEIFRPDLTLPKPLAFGPHTATVVGPDEQELWVDEFGRVKIQFHWDRLGQRNANSSCWVRVAQAWQGDQYGASHLPRIGQEVIVHFTHGDPDCPLVTGRLANRVNQSPWHLPDQHALSGFRSKELFGERHNTFLQDDTQGQIQTQIGSDHQATMLSMGHIVRVADHSGRREKRGEGYELRTDAWGVLRAGSGMLLTAEVRPNAVSYHKDIFETTKRLAGACQVHQALGDAADHLGAQASEQLDVAKALAAQHDTLQGQGEQGEFAAPHLVLAAPAAIAATAAQDIHLHSQGHTALTTGEHLSLATAKSLLASAMDRIVLFAHKAGMRLFAAKGKIEIQAQNDAIEIIAQKVLRLISAQDRVEITAAKEVLIVGNGSYVRLNESGIELGTAGTWTAHAASHAMPGPKTAGQAIPVMPDGDFRQVEHFVLADHHAGTRLVNQCYRITLASGRVIEGKTNAHGETELATSNASEIAKIEILRNTDPNSVIAVLTQMVITPK
ncbi:hypothetical protein BKK79_27560 [Cupriavidus sp. USMAA2-4]|uniref:type VI secretion system Vgr family protein n=1 Tax=Cupriavidus sp. USMAA2-4 TaxID=876364 RepID=UPI0008A70779|nr:type VI secretion system Vgr family protein [Cupriavidus sp. USMAA2-4]AOY95512.1 hypothetical protein BKK79_27560 [Cupriavidus sp. USMAA2-4]